MHTGTGQIAELILEDGCRYARLSCPEVLIPGPGQYLLASDGSSSPLPVPIFYTDSAPGGFIALSANGWKPGDELHLRGPLGRGFAVPATARKIVLIAFDDPPATQFGNPISPFEFRENLIVQYFERARFEWRADRPEGQRVVLTDLGRYYFDQLGENSSYLKPIDPIDATINSILSISARAFVMKPVALASGQQTVYIVVQSQTRQAVMNANGKATVRFTDGHTQEYFFSTNASGLGSITFDFADQKQGELIPIDILVTYQGLSATTTASFRIWF